MSIWIAHGRSESGDSFTIGYWEFEPSDSIVAEVILERYDWLIDPEFTSLTATEACEESLVYWDIDKLDLLD